MLDLTFLLLALIYLQVGVGCAIRFHSYMIKPGKIRGSVILSVLVVVIWPFITSMRVFDYE